MNTPITDQIHKKLYLVQGGKKCIIFMNKKVFDKFDKELRYFSPRPLELEKEKNDLGIEEDMIFYTGGVCCFVIKSSGIENFLVTQLI